MKLYKYLRNLTKLLNIDIRSITKTNKRKKKEKEEREDDDER
jgi:hypothetical protein